MTVKRIVTNVPTGKPGELAQFYCDLLGLDTAMDMGWIFTCASEATAAVQISFASEGGSGTPVPDISIEVDDIDKIYLRAKKLASISSIHSPMSRGA